MSAHETPLKRIVVFSDATNASQDICRYSHLGEFQSFMLIYEQSLMNGFQTNIQPNEFPRDPLYGGGQLIKLRF